MAALRRVVSLRRLCLVIAVVLAYLCVRAPIGVANRLEFSVGTTLLIATLLGGGCGLAFLLRPRIPGRTASAAIAVALIPLSLIAVEGATYVWSLGVAAFVVGGALVMVLASLRGDVAGDFERGNIGASAIIGGVGVALGVLVHRLGFNAVLLTATGAALLLVWFGTGRLAERRWGLWVWLALTVSALLWVGATNSEAQWLGPVTAHAGRDRAQVALTFDDGPNGAATLGLMRIMDERGVKGTFFVVGKGAAREPEVVRQIIADGHLVGNHSYSHDGWRFIQPTYPELERSERAIRAAAPGVCPRYYRPPHGTHTPFVWLAARRVGMRVVNWDVSARDWVATDANDLARRIVEQARPGSIILLHDGLDGRPNIDRSVLIAALPQIIDGLRAKGLDPVRLDALLGDVAYREACT